MEEISLADLRRQYETNVFGVVRVTQQVLPEMRAQGRGRIVNMSSIAGKVSSPLFGAYSSSKFALESISDAWRLELDQFGIQVILIEPGIIPSGMEGAARELSRAYIDREPGPYAAMKSGFERMWAEERARAKATPDDCARVILNALRASAAESSLSGHTHSDGDDLSAENLVRPHVGSPDSGAVQTAEDATRRDPSGLPSYYLLAC